MFRIRPIQEGDEEAFAKLAHEASYGITNLPKDSKRRGLIFKRALDTFSGNSLNPYYLFVLEKIETQDLLGVSAIYPKTGGENGICYLKPRSIPLPALLEKMALQATLLEPIHYLEGPTEICSLFLRGDARKEGLGKLLSFCRFLFMKAFPEKFDRLVYAEMRGYIDEEGNSPFWDALGRKFCPIDYKGFLMMRDRGDPVCALVPKLPIYAELLGDAAQKIIGQTHPHTLPAIKILEEQGFKATGEIDPFDAGPRMIAEREQILTIRKAKIEPLLAIEEVKAPPVLLSNTRLNFRALFAPALKMENGIKVSQETADRLEVIPDDPIIAVF